MEVDQWANYTQQLTHLTGRRAPSLERDAATRPALFAVLVAEATNIGLATMANSSGIALHELEAVYDWYFREETLRGSHPSPDLLSSNLAAHLFLWRWNHVLF